METLFTSSGDSPIPASIGDSVFRARPRLRLWCAVVLGLLAGRSETVAGQAGADTRRAQATRAELTEQLAQIEAVVGSSGYSGRLRGTKRAEADLIRQRLQEGDMQVGDQINLAVVGEAPFTGVFAVAPGRVLLLPGLPEIALKGVLRSEVQDFMKEQLKKYIRDPQVRAQSLIRLSIFGGVTKPGYLQVPAEYLAGEAIMAAGGPAGNHDPNRTVVRRNGTVIVSNDAFQEAIVQGRTLDLLNLRAGDEITVGEKKRNALLVVLPTLSALGGVVYLASRIF